MLCLSVFIRGFLKSERPRMDSDGRRSEQVGEVLDRKSGVADESSQRSLGQLLVLRDGKPAIRRVPVAEENVAAALAVELVADPAKGVDGLRA